MKRNSAHIAGGSSETARNAVVGRTNKDSIYDGLQYDTRYGVHLRAYSIASLADWKYVVGGTANICFRGGPGIRMEFEGIVLH